MRGIWLAVGATLVLLLASWGWLQKIRTDGRATADAMAAFTDFVGAENALHRAVLSAHAGSLRQYDPLVHEIALMLDALERLRQAAPTVASVTRDADALTARTLATEALVERFKSTNALLHNSLAYFSRLSAELDGTEAPATRRADGLATAVLHLVVDPSPANLAHVDAEIARIEPVHPERYTALTSLVTHASQLRILVPDMNASLAALSELAAGNEVTSERATLLARQATIAARGDAVRLLLYWVALVLVGLLAWAGAQLRARINALRRRAAIEHVVATISLRFLQTPSWAMTANLERALEELALCFDATRAYFIVPGNRGRTVTWARGGPPFPPNWSTDIVHLMTGAGLGDGGIVHIDDFRTLRARSRSDLACSGIVSWLCIARVDARRHAGRARL